MTFTQLKNKFDLNGMQSDYIGLKHSLSASWLRASKVKLPAPIIYPAIEFILSHQKWSKYLYEVLLILMKSLPNININGKAHGVNDALISAGETFIKKKL